jgi:hypothetical protein
MPNVKKFIPALAFVMSVAPLAANAKGADMLRHRQAQYVMVTPAVGQTASPFPEGRAAEKLSTQPDATVLVALPQFEAANINSARSTNTGWLTAP